MESNEFVCYSPQLYLFLRGKKIVAKKSGVNQRNGKMYTVFDVTDELSTALLEWNKTKPN